jgi:hypothetical protein
MTASSKGNELKFMLGQIHWIDMIDLNKIYHMLYCITKI